MRALLDELTRALMRDGAHLEELITKLLNMRTQALDIIAALFDKVEFDETKTSVDALTKVITGLGYVVIK